MDELSDYAERFLCNDHPRPPILEALFKILVDSDQTLSKQDIAVRLGLDPGNVPFFVLEILHLVKPSNGKIGIDDTNFARFSSLRDVPFLLKCLVLSAIAGRTWRGDSFGKQAHFLLAYEWLLRQNPSVLDFKRADTIDNINRYFTSRGFKPMSGGLPPRPILMNDVKLSYWCILAS